MIPITPTISSTCLGETCLHKEQVQIAIVKRSEHRHTRRGPEPELSSCLSGWSGGLGWRWKHAEDHGDSEWKTPKLLWTSQQNFWCCHQSAGSFSEVFLPDKNKKIPQIKSQNVFCNDWMNPTTKKLIFLIYTFQSTPWEHNKLMTISLFWSVIKHVQCVSEWRNPAQHHPGLWQHWY